MQRIAYMNDRRMSSGTMLVLGIVLFAAIVGVGRALLFKKGRTFQSPMSAPATQKALPVTTP
jgi:hypothetical protein